jgi:L,D-peptidoglycan transpeptidase YkuD (ErfK/YbiS/YcfS/YnhG family)
VSADAILPRILVCPASTYMTRGFVLAGTMQTPCALGRAGIRSAKREGDGATPMGSFRLRAVLYRADRMPLPRTHLPVTAISEDSGWCDDPNDRAYNRPVRLPFAASHERLWRDDHLYDLVVVIDFNLSPSRRGAGSAIFLHLARADFAPTAGCVAVSRESMLRLLPHLGPQTTIEIG